MIGLMDGGCSTFCRGPFKLNLKHAEPETRRDDIHDL